MNRSPTNAWNLTLDGTVCHDPQASLDHEWLVTNGLGGYAAGSLAGATTRSYHGLLVAALRPPVERSVLVTKVDEEVALTGERGAVTTYQLGVNEYEDGTIDPRGYTYLDSFGLDADIPSFTYKLIEFVTLEKRIWMEYGQNTTFAQYELRPILDEATSSATFALRLLPFCLTRDHHSVTRGSEDWRFLVENLGNRCHIRAFDGAPVIHLVMGPTASFALTGHWYWHMLHRRERERGLPDVEDVYQPGAFRIPLKVGKPVTLVMSAEGSLPADFGGDKHEAAITQALARHRRRVKQLLDNADRATSNLPQKDPVAARLVIAADQFIVSRPDPHAPRAKLTPNRKTVIAGYPWFTDWGRDSMISLPGLLLSTGRYSEARGLLKAFASYTNQGLIPNRFPDSGEVPEYNTADATLWMFHALNSYTNVTQDWSLVKELYPTLSEIIEWHQRGTLYGIGVDPADGLLRAGAPGVQLTWMDAIVDGWVVTPRQGKPVEINALWYCALRYMEKWANRLSFDALEYGILLSEVRENFARRYWYDAGGYLYDVIDVDGVPGQNDAALRPNQLFAASLTHRLLSEEQTRSMLQHVTDDLLTPMGLRTLSPHDPHYRPHFNGPRLERDSAYHQGTVWPWLIGTYIDVRLRLHNDKAALLPLLKPLAQHLWDNCAGSICEVAEPEPPYAPAGCFAQAWSVGEMLRTWLAVTS